MADDNRGGDNDSDEGSSPSMMMSNQHHTLSLLDEPFYHPNSPFANIDQTNEELFLVTDRSRLLKSGWLGHLASARKDTATTTDCS
eukprot:8277039-Ditylum_brightwellii.AAC.1